MKIQTRPNNPPCIQNFDCQIQGVGFEAVICDSEDPEAVCRNWDGRWLKPVDPEAFKEWVERGNAGMDIPDQYMVSSRR